MITAAVSAGAVSASSRWSRPASAASIGGVLVGRQRIGERAHVHAARAAARARRGTPSSTSSSPSPCACGRGTTRWNTIVFGRSRDLLGELHRGFGDLGPGVGEEERVDRPRRDLGELGGERLEQVVGEHVDLGVDEALGLGGDGGRSPSGGQCPVELTAIPAAKSRYSTPSTVVTLHPRPDATCRSVTLNHTFDRCDMAASLRTPRSREVPASLRRRNVTSRDVDWWWDGLRRA